MASSATAAELRRAALFRADELDEIVRHLRGPLGQSRSSLQEALTLAGEVPQRLRDFVSQEVSKVTDADSRVQLLIPLLRHLNYVLDFVEQHLSHGTHRELSEALADEIGHELVEFGLVDHRVVLSHGGADNYETRHGDLSAAFFGPLTRPGVPPPAAALFALFKVPRLEGARVQWRPVLLGHEVTHVAAESKGGVAAFDLPNKFDAMAAGQLPNPNSRPGAPPATIALGVYRIAEAWTTELICDLHALHRFGPAAIAALAEYFICIGAMETSSKSHPPGLLRIRLLLDQLGTVGDSRLASLVQPWADDIPAVVNLSEPWAKYVADLFTTNLPDLAAATSMLGTTAYDAASRLSWIHATADRFRSGIPGRELISSGGSLQAALPADVVNATWLARAEDATTPFDQLAQKTIESIGFVTKWTAHGGDVPLVLHERRTDADTVLASEGTVAVLPEQALLARMRLDHPEKGLTVSPALHLPKGTGLDLRLGMRFIVFRRTATAVFDPLDLNGDPRAVQVYVELSETEQLVLHPQELVLGATLEYLALPDDLSGQVITRSSYGRLGLLSATAVQIHPRFRGCLTLELVNLSTIPIALTPGERIAQLILWKSGPVPPGTDKYTHPIGPEFSRVRADAEAQTLRQLRA